MKIVTNIVFLLLAMIFNSPAFGFVDQIAVSPLAPSAGRPITISFRSGVCDGPDTPLVWQLVGTGQARDLIVNGLPFQEPLFCLIDVSTTSIVIGELPPGSYEIHIKIRNPLDGLGGIPSPSYGSVQFTVGQALPIPTLRPLSLVIFAAILLGIVVLGRRRHFSVLGVAVLAVCIAPTSDCQAQEPALLEVTMAPWPAPSPESIVEGYDFASGLNPPFPALTAGDPTYAVYLLPFRAPGEVSARLGAHPQSLRAKLERTILIAYTSEANRSSDANGSGH